MRSIVALYFLIGAVLLGLGFFATGPCDNKNDDIVNHTVFVLTWPVGLYNRVLEGNMTPTDWLHTQTCGSGLGPRAPKPAAN